MGVGGMKIRAMEGMKAAQWGGRSGAGTHVSEDSREASGSHMGSTSHPELPCLLTPV